MAHGSKVHLPEVFPIKKMCEPKTAALLASENGNVAHADGRGAEVCNVDLALLHMTRQVIQHGRISA